MRGTLHHPCGRVRLTADVASRLGDRLKAITDAGPFESGTLGGTFRRFADLESVTNFSSFTASEMANMFTLFRVAIQSGKGVLNPTCAKVTRAVCHYHGSTGERCMCGTDSRVFVVC